MKLVAYTDGACSGNPGPGGWGVLLRAVDGDNIVKERELYGSKPNTTNNQMELQAAIEALRALNKPSQITIITDSNYVKNGISDWIHNWKQNQWRTSNKKEVKNAELWQTLDQLNQAHQVEWQWIKGHAGHEGNERADELARKGVSEVKEA